MGGVTFCVTDEGDVSDGSVSRVSASSRVTRPRHVMSRARTLAHLTASALK